VDQQSAVEQSSGSGCGCHLREAKREFPKTETLPERLAAG
jgi:hypothetical protein